MSKKTENYGLTKPEVGEFFSLETWNGNLDKIDEELKKREDEQKESDNSLMNPEFTEAKERKNLTSGEKIHLMLGKISKFFSDMKAIAFSGSYNDLVDKPKIPTVLNNQTTTEEGYALDARQANPNIDGTLAKKVADLNGSFLLKFQRFTVTTTEITVNSDSYIKLLYPQSYKELIALIPMFIRPRSHWNSRGTFWNFDGSQINFRVIGLESASAQTFDIEYYWVYK